uniref:Ankyrin repeat protein n=1 Tax=Acrobeloides nanus TaxID=290746 RepID=A0A914CN88_9BILA
MLQDLLQERQSLTSDSDQITKNVALFNAIRKKPNEISEEARRKKVEKYLNEGADINAQDKNDQENTVLHIAVKKDYPEIVKMLLEKEAKISILNSDGKSPLDLALEQNNRNLIQILTENIHVPADDSGICDLPSMPQSLQIKRSVEDTGSEVKKNKLDEPQSSSTVGTSSIFGKRKLSSSDNGNNSISPIKKSDTFAAYEPSEYSSSIGLKSSFFHGTIYQLKLLILFLQRGLHQGYSFRLATEMDAAEKFDDLAQGVK